MIKVENIAVSGIEAAIRGMRNPLSSWDRADSYFFSMRFNGDEIACTTEIGPNDMNLARKLYKAGPEHRKYLRMVHISADITAPDYWFKEFDTYRIGVTENSTSTMHTITKKPFTLEDFSLEDMPEIEALSIVRDNEDRRKRYIETKAVEDWRALIQGLPMSYNYRRTVDFNCEVAIRMIQQRTGHKLSEWREFVHILENIPLIKALNAE